MRRGRSQSPLDRALSVRLADVVLAAYILATIAVEDGTLLAQVSRVLLIAVAVLEIAVKPPRITFIVVWQVVFAGFAALSIQWAFSEARAENLAITVAINGACVIAVGFLVINDPARLRIAMVCTMIAPTLLMLQIASSDGLFVFVGSRATDGGVNANFVGQAAAIAFGFAYLARSHPGIAPRWLADAFVVINVAVVLLSASRKALVMVPLMLLLFAWFNARGNSTSRNIRTIAAGAIGISTYWLVMNVDVLYTTVGYRIEGAINGLLGNGGDTDASTTTRLALIDRGYEWFLQNPWIGSGADGFRAQMEVFYPGQSVFYAHNNYVELLVSYGVMGLAIYYLAYLVILVTGLRKLKKLYPIQAMMLSVIVAMLFMEVGQVDYYSRFFVALIAIAWVAVSTKTLESSTPTTNKPSPKTARSAL